MRLIYNAIFLLLIASPLQAQETNPFISGNSSSHKASLSADGRYVAFVSDSTNLVLDDDNKTTDVFVRDMQSGVTTRVSVASDGTEANDYSTNAKISADGRFVVFESEADNLVPDDTNGWTDIFVHNLETGETSRVSVGSDGTQGDLSSLEPVISGDGRTVAFWTNAANLVADDTNMVRDVIVHDLETGETTRASVASDGTQANDETYDAVISDDGRYIAFWSRASNLVEGDTNSMEDIFVHDRETGETTRVNVASDGTQANAYTFEYMSISSDGRYVAFQSQATNLVSGDNDAMNHIFVHDQQTGETSRVSLTTEGALSGCDDFCLGSSNPSISGDGQFVVFTSDMTGLIEGDTNESYDVFLHDRQTGATTRVSVNNDGEELNSTSTDGVISRSGQFIAFETGEALIATDFNFTTDVYWVDRETGEIVLVSGTDKE
jgi:Tol biopolymer transport system component